MTVKLVSARVVVELDAVVAVVPTCTCNTRKAPRKSFNCAAVKTVFATNAAGSVVTAAIVLLYIIRAHLGRQANQT